MTSRTRRRSLVAVLAAVLALTLSGCGATPREKTDQSYNPTNGANGRVSDMKVLNVIVAAGQGGHGITELLANVVNIGEEPDRLTDVVVQGTGATIAPTGSLVLSPLGTLTFGPGQQRLFLPASTLQPGYLTSVRFTFAKAGVLELPYVLVQAYGDITAGG